MGGNWGPACLPHLPLHSGPCQAHPEPPPGWGPCTMRGCRAGSWVPGEPASGCDSGSPGRWGEDSRRKGGGGDTVETRSPVQVGLSAETSLAREAAPLPRPRLGPRRGQSPGTFSPWKEGESVSPPPRSPTPASGELEGSASMCYPCARPSITHSLILLSLPSVSTEGIGEAGVGAER